MYEKLPVSERFLLCISWEGNPGGVASKGGLLFLTGVGICVGTILGSSEPSGCMGRNIARITHNNIITKHRNKQVTKLNTFEMQF